LGCFISRPFSTPLFYKQTDELHFSPQAIGNLSAFGGGLAILAGIVYGQLITRSSIRILLFISILAVALETLFYLFYSGGTRAVLIKSQNGFFFGFAEVALIDLAARSTPKGCEGLGYALILSVTNVASFGADVVGSHLADNHWPFAHRVYLKAGTTAIVLALLPFLPSALMRSKDVIQSSEDSSTQPLSSGGDIRDRVIRIGPQPRARPF
jgi:predicted MFS family arabinose efflux permease